MPSSTRWRLPSTPDGRPITVVVFQGEAREFALARHRELRPDHAGRPVRFEDRRRWMSAGHYGGFCA